MSYKIIQWGTGAVGKHALRAVLDDPDMQLVGVKVYSEQKVGLDAGTLCDRPETGVKAVLDQSQLPLMDADCILYMPMLPDYEEIANLLRAGINVVTTAANMYPKAYGEEVFNNLNQAALEGKSVFHGSGINPAFMSDVLPLTLSGMSHRVSKIIVQEVSDVHVYASQAPEIMMDNIGFGKTPEEALRPDNPFLEWMSAYFHESMYMLAEHMQVKLDRIEPHHEVAVANNAVQLGNDLVIEAGSVACRRFEWRGIINGKDAIVLRTFWKTTLDIEPAWAVDSNKEVEWTVTVEGTPSYQAKVEVCASFDPLNVMCGKGGEDAAVIGTAMHAINAIPVVCKAAPGVRTFLDLPIIASHGAFR
ncbi:hypothetical protein H2508_11345 [Parahaliea sp. F7430]|uniref:2,4-diaminopentanoate dehydrogenase C-terminal domain-containing protein n=1 Tax=Sediminihaliea albiluteola TaxID=2758564 RepID=A0A7W2YKH3_9GAMM|nr:hypothetical protein [Sediminihaliea albiluteola]MBA6413704.1 hypothetical protein [Sediminihaliea albiluteola]